MGMRDGGVPLTERIEFRLSRDERLDIERIAKDQRRTLSSLLRDSVRETIEKEKQP